MSGATLQLPEKLIKHSTVSTDTLNYDKDILSNAADNDESSIAFKLERDKIKKKYESKKLEKNLIQEQYNSLQIDYKNLLKKYNEKEEQLQSLQIFNKKLQKMTLEKNSDNNGMYNT